MSVGTVRLGIQQNILGYKWQATCPSFVLSTSFMSNSSQSLKQKLAVLQLSPDNSVGQAEI